MIEYLFYGMCAGISASYVRDAAEYFFNKKLELIKKDCAHLKEYRICGYVDLDEIVQTGKQAFIVEEKARVNTVRVYVKASDILNRSLTLENKEEKV
jgi:type II secretory pathway component PulL